jgi:dihydroflavonol-4-reductase
MTGAGAKTVLVTGGAGFLGKRVVRRLAEAGRSVRALVRPGTPPTVFASCLDGLPGARVDLVEASFGDMDALRRAIDGADVILHLAASTVGSAAAQVANSVVGSENLFRAALDVHTPRLVLVSSFGVIGVSAVRRGGVVDESVGMEPHAEWRDAYSFAKQRQEALAWKYQRDRGLPLVVVRPGPIFGPGQPILGTRVGVKFFGLFLHLGGGNLVPLTYVDNCADAVVKAGDVPGIEGQVFCVVDDDLPTSRQLLRLYKRRVAPVRSVRVPFFVLKQAGRWNAGYSARTHNHLPAVFTPYKVDALWVGRRYSNARAKQVLGWSPQVPMAEALDRTLASLRPAT